SDWSSDVCSSDLQPVVPSGRAPELPCKFPVPTPGRRGVFTLRCDVCAGEVDHLELVATDAPVEDLLFAGLGIEAPGIRLTDQWNRQRPLLLAYDQHRPLLAIQLDRM